MYYHENVTRPHHRLTESFRRPSLCGPPRHAAVIREGGGFVWELRKADLVAYGRSPIHYATAAKAQAAGDRALERGFRSTI